MQVFFIITFILLFAYCIYIQIKVNRIAGKYGNKFGWGVVMRDLNEQDKKIVKKYFLRRYKAIGIAVVILTVFLIITGISKR